MNRIHAYLAEFAGTGLLLMIVVGSGIMAEQLAGGNNAVALLGNSIATGAGLYVLIVLLGPISGAHFNPVVSLLMWHRNECPSPVALIYMPCQILGAATGVWISHAMFNLEIFQYSTKLRSDPNLWLSEIIATLVLLGTIHLGTRRYPERTPMMVAMIVTSGYWFTSSTFFANPAVTIARSLSNTFAGIAPESVFKFIASQLIAAAIVLILIKKPPRSST
jgi:glycerol uptake facilitator-like aquaporin